MFCPKCGTEVKEGSRFCGSCGNQLVDDVKEETKEEKKEEKKTIEPVVTTEKTIGVEEDLIDAYMGIKAQKLKTSSFSFCTFFFGAVYFLYRKMYLYGLLWLLVFPIVCGIIPVVGPIASIAAPIVMGFFFKTIYLQHVETKVREIKNAYRDKSHEELLELCKKLGGTTIVPVIIVVILNVIVIAIIALAVYALISTGELSDIFEETIDSITSENIVYEVDTNESLGGLNYLIPANFEETYKYGNYTRSYDYTGKDYSERCSFEIHVYDTTEEDVEKNLKDSIYVPEGAETEEKHVTINDRDWYNIDVFKSYGTDNNYEVITNNKIYRYQFSTLIDGEVCGAARKNVTNSLIIGE